MHLSIEKQREKVRGLRCGDNIGSNVGVKIRQEFQVIMKGEGC